MSVIKSTATTRSPHVRPFGLAAPEPDPSPIMVELERLQDALAASEARERDLRTELAGRAEAEARAIQTARNEGKAEGQALADTRHAEQVAIISAAADAAQKAFADKLAVIERLAAGFAGEALARITGDPDRHADLLAATIQRELAGVASDAVVAIEVSPSDFPNSEALAALYPNGSPVVQAVPTMPAGGCRIRLKLGEIDLGLHSQTARLRQILDAYADGIA